jgi:hypothetical protein
MYASAMGSAAEAFTVPETSSPVVAEFVLAAVPVGTVPVGAVSADALPFVGVPSGVLASVPLAVDAWSVGFSSTVNPAAVPTRFLSTVPSARSILAQLPGMTGMALLAQLGGLPEQTTATFLASHPHAISELLAAPPAATDVSAWWDAMGVTQQAALKSAAPQLVGNLDGVPVSARNTANRAWVAQTKKALEASDTSASGRAMADTSERQIQMLTSVQTVLGTKASVPARSLLSVDPTGAGKAAVVLGNLATADYVTYLIPGMFFTVGGQVGDWTDDAARVYDEEVSWLSLIGKDHPGEATKTVAVVAWMGYETPNLTNIGSLDLADKGRDAIAHVVEGLQAQRAGDEPYITLIAHSYGSTAALMALTEYNFTVDALAVVGSPGSAAQSVKDLHVRNGNVFVGEAAWDPVPNSAFFGSDPGSPSYGAKRMDVGGGVDLITNQVLAASIGHNGYFDAGSESVRNMALIGIGQGELVTTGASDDKTRTLALVK